MAKSTANENRKSYRIDHAEIDRNPAWDGVPTKGDDTLAYTIRTAGGTITANGVARQTPRLAITSDMLSREVPGTRVNDKANRVIEFTMTVERTGRKAKTGTDLSVFDL